MSRLRARLLGLVAAAGLLTFLAGVPAVLVGIGADPLPNDVPTWQQIQESLGRPDDGTLLLHLLAALAWVAWAFCATTILIEIAAMVRGVRAPKLPGLAAPQAAARVVVSAAALLFLASTAVPATALESATLNDAVPALSTAQVATSAATAREQKSEATPPTDMQRPDPRTVTVRRGDSLWQLAEQHLGDGARYREIKNLNHDVLAGHDGFLLPGMVLRLPDAPTHHALGSVTVQPGDTLSGIARDELGDATQWPQIFDASTDTQQPDGAHLTDPDLIRPGWKLAVPDAHTEPAHQQPAHEHEPVARPGTTPRHEPTHTPPSESTAPAAIPRPAADTSEEPTGAVPDPHVLSLSDVPVPGTSRPAHAGAPSAPQGAGNDDHTAAAAAEQAQVMPWAVTGLTGAGAVLAGSILLALRMRRRAQWRARRPGRTIAAPPPELAPVEKTVVAAGTESAATLELMDDVLRRLGARAAAAGGRPPRVAAVQLSEDRLTLHLSEPADLEQPWQDDGNQMHWTFLAGTDIDSVGPAASADQPAPWPLLVTIGASDDGDVWLLNLEDAGTISLTGDDAHAVGDFARYVAAELAVNAWSAQVTVECIGVADEVAGMDPARIQIHHDTQVTTEVLADAITILDRATSAGTDVVTGRTAQLGDELWAARVMLLDTTRLTAGTDDHTAVDELVQVVTQFPARTGTALVLTAEQQQRRGTQVHLTAGGRLQIPSVGLDLARVGLTAEEALGCAALLAASDDLDDAPIPHSDHLHGWRAWSDEAGNLRTEYTLPRTDDLESGPPPAAGAEARGLELVDSHEFRLVEAEEEMGEQNALENDVPPTSSILEGPDETYLAAAATTRSDLQALAPRVPVDLQERVEESDPSLDDDLAMWHDEDCPLPRLTLLGPVTARTRGNARAVAKRKPYYTELLAYLATRPTGATPAQVADAFGLRAGRVRTDITTLRDWLGSDPRTGQKHLPAANESAAAKDRGVGVYQLSGVLVDADLFRRLRTRAQARGRAGHEDLLRALHLVSGPPFTQLREGGWSWLSEGDRLDQHMLCAVVDVAHLVTVQALADGDITRARVATEIAALAAPHEEIPRLDLAAVAEAEGHHAAAEWILREDICDRSDDGQAPMDLSSRTKEILRQRDWLLPGKRAS